MKKDFLDLRLIIGLFFLLVGLILFIGSFVMKTTEGKSEVTNFWSGMVYVIFGAIMILFWMRHGHKTDEQEVSEDSEQ